MNLNVSLSHLPLISNLAICLSLLTTFPSPAQAQSVPATTASSALESFRYGDASGTGGIPPLSPKDSLSKVKTHSELRVDLVAAEPMVADPVAIDFGPDGRIWVAEMIDYARGAEEEFESTGQIRSLVDQNDDGIPDQATVFIGGLRFPTDVKVWRNGILICDAPDVFYAEDTDGDGKADLKQVLFTGFETYNGQARVNSLQWGLDNWIYGSCGLTGGFITRGDYYRAGGLNPLPDLSDSQEPVNLRGRDFRMRPDTGEIEAVTGRTQQSRVRDDWGNWFGCDNETLAKFYPVSERDLKRNPFVPAPETSVYVPDGENAGKLFPDGDLVLFKLSGSGGRATAACGIGIYRDVILGSEFQGNSFTCEPVNQLIYRQVLARKDALIRGSRAASELDREFMTSTDRWFRPVQARTGPDGGMWIVDMYRFVIEHARWIPEDVLAELNVFAGQGMGRIYRVGPKNRALRKVKDLTKLSSVELAQQLSTENGTTRDLVHQMLVWKKAVDASPILEKLSTADPLPSVRVSALCCLDGIGSLSEPVLGKALRDSDPEVRRHAVRLSSDWLDRSESLRTSVLNLANDSSFVVRLQTAAVLADVPAEAASPVIVSMLSHSNDPWLTSAVLSSLNRGNILSVLQRVISESSTRDQSADRVLATAAGICTSEQLEDAFRVILRKDSEWMSWQFRAMAQLLDGTDRRTELQYEPSASLRQSAMSLLETAREILTSRSGKDEQILAAMTLVGRAGGAVTMKFFGSPSDTDLENLTAAISPAYSSDVQSAAIQSIVRQGSIAGAESLLARLSETSPSVRREILTAILSQQGWRSTLLNALESGNIQPGELDATLRDQIVSHPDREVRRRAEKLLAVGTTSNRRQLVEDWQDVAAIEGNSEAGRAVYVKRCSVCHKLDNVGYAVGPDLAALTRKSTNSLLTAILDPNRDSDSRYHGYIAITDDGRSWNGLMVNETGTSVTLREQEGKEHVLLRNRIEELRATGKSLMPEGLEKDISRQDMAHLIAFLIELGPAPRRFPGNQPKTVLPDGSGEIVLTPQEAAIYGHDVRYQVDAAQPQPSVPELLDWKSPDDFVSWRLQLPSSGLYDTWMIYSCHDFGSDLRLEAGDTTIRHLIASTGSWETFDRALIGTVSLNAGHNTLVIRPFEKLRGKELMHLREIRLIPAAASGKPSQGLALSPLEVARQLLDDGRSEEERKKLIEKTSDISAALIRSLTADLPDNEEEEYRRIPWIWRVAIAAGKRNDANEILAVLDASLPRTEQPLRDWQAVVLGGGIINGISLSGGWPRDRIDRLIAGNFDIQPRWEHSVAEALVMCDNEAVRKGTRYDALRMAAMLPWSMTGQLLSRYIGKGIDEELQMGAISAMADMPAADAGRTIIENLTHYGQHNRSLALDAMLRTGPRINRLLNFVEAGTIKSTDLGDERVRKIREHSDAQIRARAEKLFPALTGQ
ncbi:MAG: PVC-type heme-binding CxxCH protein [Planctomyces sp.]